MKATHQLIAITGGIGSGKSVVSHILRCMGYPVYDTDTRARKLMDESALIKRRIADEVSAEAICSDFSIDRRALASCVFSHAGKLDKLNRIVHQAVLKDLEEWYAAISGTAFVETAILYTSGLDGIVDEVWSVESPRELRISRVISRNNASRADVEARMEAQLCETNPKCRHKRVRIIVNDGISPLLPQLADALGKE